ncbi:MAG: hypothetical protein BGO01_18235 [Armatimonadetes bacterium 55-13]|nr:MAG: hypothetical protein BGO01_18235 [Armatimonadetes bacterium 55-13]
MTSSLFLQDVACAARPRLSEVLFGGMERRFGTLAELPSNVEAIDAALQFATGSSPFVAVVGPSGWGKTHLLECVSYRLSQEYGYRPPIISAVDWLNGQATVDPKLPLLVDDAQDAVLRTRSKVQLKLALERRVRTGRPAMLAFTSDKLTRQHLSFLPNVREWALHEIATPKADERVFVVEQMAKFEGLQISRYIARVLASRMRGNGNTLHGAINRLRTYGRSWITPSEVLEACGILDPFFADNPDWDLKEKIQQAWNRIASTFPNVEGAKIVPYVMSFEARLSEADIARHCQIEPSQVHDRSLAFKKQLNSKPELQSCLNHFVETIAESLQSN